MPTDSALTTSISTRISCAASLQSLRLPAKLLRLLAFAVAAPIVCPVKSTQKRVSMRVSIITGGGSGIGAAVARRLAASDQCLMLHGQGADAAGLERLKAVAKDCQRAGANVEFRTGDLANAGTASELVGATRAAFGPVDAVVHAAGFADRRDASSPSAALRRIDSCPMPHIQVPGRPKPRLRCWSGVLR